MGKDVSEDRESINPIVGPNKLVITREGPGALACPFVAFGKDTVNPNIKLRDEGGLQVSKNNVGFAINYKDTRRVKCLEDIEDIEDAIFDNISKKTKRKLKKAKQGQKKKGNLKGVKFVNESLSDGDFINSNKKNRERSEGNMGTWEIVGLLSKL